MSVAKLKASNSQVAMKSDEGNESLDTIIRHAIGKEPFLSFSRAGDSPVQWIQLLHALDQPDLPGWPLLSPLKVQMKKCDKCSREFCSPINHRRHIRVDHRPRKLDSTVDRDKLRTFWDELSLDKALETVSFENATLEDVTGSSIIASLISLVKKQGFSSLPQAYVKAGSALLGLVQGDFHERIPSEKLFSILDDASEKTFLCGKVEAVQKYVFDGEAGKIDLEKNIVACTSFLVEQKLVKAWHDHKDLEAMEAQESLLLEEDAAKESGKGLQNSGQTRKLKPQKKLKKKEGKSKAEVKESAVDMRKTLHPAETATPFDVYASDSQPPQAQSDTVHAFLKSSQLPNTDGDFAAEAPSASGSVHLEPQITQNVERGNAKVRESTVGMLKAIPHSETPSCDVSVSDSHPREMLASLEPIQHSNTDENTVPIAPSGSGCGHAEAGIKHNVERGTGRRDIVHRRQVPSKSRGMANVGFHGTHSDQRAVPIPNVNKVWTPKPKPDFDGESSRIRILKEAANQSAHDNKCEVFIVGSIPVTLGRSDVRQQDDLPRVHDDYLAENQMPKQNHVPEKPAKQNSVRGSTHRLSGMHWRPVSRHETGAPLSVQSGYRESDTGTASGKGDIRESGMDAIIGKGSENTPNFLQKGSPGDLSSTEAKAFLAQRWKEAIAANHVKLIQSPDLELPSCPDPDPEPNSDSQIATVISSKLPKATGSVKSSSAGAARSKSRKPEKGVTTRYIPKDKTTIVS